MRLILDQNQRRGLAAALYNLGNVTAAALIIGQFVAATPFRFRSFILGMILFVGAYVIATKLNREEQRS